MVIDLTFDSVCKLVKSEHTALKDDIDILSNIFLALGVTCASGPISVAINTSSTFPLTTATIFLTALSTLSSLYTVKNEFPKIAKKIVEVIASKTGNDPREKLKRMERAYYLMCYTAFFEALGEQKHLAIFMKKVNLTREEKIILARTASTKLSGTASMTIDDFMEDIDASLKFPISLPHPADTFEIQSSQLIPLYTQLTEGLENFLKSLAVWNDINETEQAALKQSLDKLPEEALTFFRVQYFLLASRYEDFYLWSNLQKYEKDSTQIQKMSEFMQSYFILAKNNQDKIDTGFKNMAEVISRIPEQIEMRQVNSTLQNLMSFYKNAIDTPIIKNAFGEGSKQQLTYPKKSEMFIPQAFKVFHYISNKQLESESTWENLPVYNDLGTFLISYFSHPDSGHMPLIILGQPGSGKSLLTSMMAARLISPSFTPIRVELRNVNADADVTLQIKDQIYNDTKRQIDWATLADHFMDCPAIVLLDGYDELLQASGKVFSSYLSKVQQFQEYEIANGRQPVRTVVTSRITLIDKAEIPNGATIIQLLEFDEERQSKWIALWNAANTTYFRQIKVRPFALPKNNRKINELAKQPLLLMMLAIYDMVAGNQLHTEENLDQSLLYDNLLRQFIERELKKEESLQSLKREELDKLLDREMQRLGVAAMGMFNRRSLYIDSAQLNSDLKYFELERDVPNAVSGFRLTQAELLLGSFFFVQESRAVQKNMGIQKRENDTTFEFLHNTFGEFLTADFMLSKILKETGQISDLKKNPRLQEMLTKQLKQIDGLEPGWFARFMYAPLFSRPVIMNLIREWLKHCLHKHNQDEKEFLEGLDSIVATHIELLLSGNILPPIMTKSDQYLPVNLPVLGYMAIYTLNLILIRTILSSDSFTFSESAAISSADGTRAWDRLTHLWRSWFSLETLNELAATLIAQREDTNIHLSIKNFFETSSSDNRLNLVRNVSKALADNTIAGLSDLILHDVIRADKDQLDDINKRLLSDQIDLNMDILIKELRYAHIDHTTPTAEILNRLRSTREYYTSMSYHNFNSESYTSLINIVTVLAQETDTNRYLSIYERVLFPVPYELITDEMALAAIKLAVIVYLEPAIGHFGVGYAKHLVTRGRFASMSILNELDRLLDYNSAKQSEIKEENNKAMVKSDRVLEALKEAYFEFQEGRNKLLPINKNRRIKRKK